jgi:hypothetical protein
MRMMKIIAVLTLAAGTVFSQVDKNPAARVHVKIVNGVALKQTSKLANVVELNFTMGNTHRPGKQIIATALDRIATSYGFAVKHITSSLDGSTVNEVPNFTITDLSAAEVIVANNISAFGSTTMGTQKQQALQQAIEVDGKGYLGFHGSGDNSASGWAWFTNSLHPMNYQGHGSRTVGPVYKHVAEAKHIVMQGVLEKGTTNATVPNELDATGKEVLATNIPTRGMKNEWYRFGRDISRDALFKDKVTILLKYDPRGLGSDALPTQNKRLGGNLYTYIYKVGKGLTSYIPAGHEDDELMAPATGFDGGQGDFDRYLAQTLFFQAGYTQTACNATCTDLPIVDANNRLTGDKYVPTGTRWQAVANRPELRIDPVKMAFSSTYDRKFAARVTDLSGRLIYQKNGSGRIDYEFDQSRLKAGVYFLSVRIGSAPAQVRRYALLPSLH